MAYYSTFLVLMVFNIIFNKNKRYGARNWIGIQIEQTLDNKVIYVTEIILNSLSSVLSYNNFNFETIFSDKDTKQPQKNVDHESTFVKQLIYFLMVTSLNAGYKFVNIILILMQS